VSLKQAILNKLGSDADAASESGTLHAKAKAILNDVDPIKDSATAGSPTTDSIEDELDRSLTALESETGTADSGGRGYLVDSDLTEGDFAWEGALVVMTSSANAGLSRAVTRWQEGVNTLHFDPPFPNAVSGGDGYTIVPGYLTGLLHYRLDDGSVLAFNNSLADQVFIGAGEQLRNFIAKTGATEVPAGLSIADLVGVLTGPTSGTHTLSAGTTEEDIFEVTGITTPTKVMGLLDLVNATTDKMIRVYEKIDGSTYRVIDPSMEWVTADENGVRISFTAQNDFKVSVQSVSDEGNTIDIPFRHSRRVRA